MDPATIELWWRKSPNANVGVATGEVSGLIVLDFDPRNGGREKFGELVNLHGPLPRTPASRTGGRGRHYFFHKPGSSKTRHLGGLDIVADGSYVVMPPSKHVSYLSYRWNVSPAEIEPAELPPGWSNLSERPGSEPSQSVVREGGRNLHLTSHAGALRRRGLGDTEVLDELSKENLKTCSPPLAEAEVAKIAASISTYPVGTGDAAEQLAQLVLDMRFAGGEHLIYARDRQFWCFTDTHWRPLGQKPLEGVILDVVKTTPRKTNASTSGLIKQVADLLAASRATDEDVLRFEESLPAVINCRNGELWIDDTTGDFTFRPHGPSSYLRHCLEIDYVPGAKCPSFDRALSEIFAADPKGLTRLWRELMGYLIQPDRRTPMIVICRGEGSNGKTALVETIVRLLGKEHVAAMAIQDIEKSRFAIGGLLNKLMLLDDDVRAGARLPDGQLKRLSEAKTLTGENKYGPPFTFTARALPVLLCNSPPSVADLSYGMTRRVLVIPFDRRFEGSEADKTLFQGIWRSEMSGVLNRALTGLQGFIRRGWQLDKPPALEEATARWLAEANPVPAFVKEECEAVGKAYVADLYRAFVDWCERNGISRSQQRSTFQQNLVRLNYKTSKGNRGVRVVGLQLRAAGHRLV